MWLHVNQRPMRARCEAILARAATGAAPEHRLPSEAIERELLDVLAAVRLVDGARRGTTAVLFTEVGDPADRHRTIERAIPARGALRRGRAVAAVLVLGAVLVGLPTTLLDDYAALRALDPDIEAPLFWSIVDAALARLELRLRTLAKSADAGSRSALADLVVALEATAGGARDPEIATRARTLAAQLDALRR